MRIVCPGCEAAYEVPQAMLSPGRAVRCARCGGSWMPLPDLPGALADLKAVAASLEGREVAGNGSAGASATRGMTGPEVATPRSAAGERLTGRRGRAAPAQIVIFPEGTRTAPGERVPWQPGVAALASATGLPVVPAATDSGRLWGRRSFAKRPGTITLAVLPALPSGLPRIQLMQRLENEVEEASAALLAQPCG